MLEIPAPASDAPLAARTLAACLASILERPLADLPRLAGIDPVTAARQWLAIGGLGLVRAAEPEELRWAGPWIGRVDAPDGQDRYVVLFGAPSGVVWDPAGGPDVARSAVREALFVAPLDPARAGVRPGTPGAGVVAGLFVAEAPEAPMRAVDEARAVAGRGLRGDRYADGRGTFSVRGGTGGDLTLVAAEALVELELPDGAPLAPEATRRNVLTRDIDVDALVGRRFRIGDVACLGQRLCEPCAHLQRLTRPGVLRALVHRGGLRADVLADGRMAVGDRVVPVDS